MRIQGEIMAKPKPKEVIIEGTKLPCPVCKHNLFYERKTRMKNELLSVPTTIYISHMFPRNSAVICKI